MQPRGNPIRSMTLPLFLNVWFGSYVQRRFGFLGSKVVRAGLYWGAQPLAFECGAVIGRARPELVDRVIRSQSDPGSDVERLKATMRASYEDRLAHGHLETFWDLFDWPDGEPTKALRSKSWVDADYAVGDLTLDTMAGLVFGSEHPETTVQLAGQRFSEESAVRAALKEAGLKLPVGGADFRTYHDWEEYWLRLVDEWEERWGALAR